MNLFCNILYLLKNRQIIKNFLKDLLNRQERIMLIRRLLIANLLLEEKSYREIQQRLRVGTNTISRIGRWLHFGRNGYKIAIKVNKKK